MNQDNKNRGLKANFADLMRLLADALIQFKDAPPLLQKRVHASTAWRWTNRGANGIKLETVGIEGKRLTSVQAVTRFLKRTSTLCTRCAEYFRIQLRPRTNPAQSIVLQHSLFGEDSPNCWGALVPLSEIESV